MPEQYFQHTFPNGLTLLAERISTVRSATLSLLIPAGSATDPTNASGSASVLSDLVLRGAGPRDSRELTDYLDGLGLHRYSSAGLHHTHLSCAALASNVMESIPTYADIVRRPHLPKSGFEAARDLSLQMLEGLEDDPRQKVLVKLREWFFPAPLGRNTMGVPEHLAQMTRERCRADWQRRYQPNQAIFSIAGNIKFQVVKDTIERHFGDFEPRAPLTFQMTPPPGRYYHGPQDSEQTHIGIAYPSTDETDPDYYVVRLIAEVLGGSTSGRLFTEVREKRGLCYSVWAGYTGAKGLGGILAYAGSSNDKAQQTLDCTIHEIRRMASGITQQELDRAKIGLKSNTIIDGESTAARAGAIAHDFFIRGRIRTLDEIQREIDVITLDRLNDYLAKHPAGPFTVVIIGPKELVVGGM